MQPTNRPCDGGGAAGISAGATETASVEGTRQLEAADLAKANNISEDEALDWLDDRVAVNDLVGEIQRDRADEFAGLYFTGDNGDYVLHIVFAEGHEGAALTIPATLKALRVVSEVGPKTQSELQATAKSIIAEYAVSAASADELTGTIIVEAKDQDAAERIAAKYGDAVRITGIGEVVGSACNTTQICTPWRGGIPIAENGTNVCTFGVVAKGNSGTMGWKMITAGHCGSTTWSHNGTTIGTTARNCLLDSDECQLGSFYAWTDIQKVPYPATDPYGPPRNCVMPATTTTCYELTNGAKNSWEIAVGDTVHYRGFKSGYHSLVHIAENVQFYTVSQDPNGHILTGFRVDDAAGAAGDSGGPATWGNYVWGLVSGGTSVRTFAYASDIELAVNVTICRTTNC